MVFVGDENVPPRGGRHLSLVLYYPHHWKGTLTIKNNDALKRFLCDPWPKKA